VWWWRREDLPLMLVVAEDEERVAVVVMTPAPGHRVEAVPLFNAEKVVTRISNDAAPVTVRLLSGEAAAVP
jgi:hypothetical protein